jgi:photosystem II stability/assembly factor-like uncharacterized protein
MRSFFFPLSLMLAIIPAVRAAVPHHPEDAALYAVQMVDAKEGWAVGEEGVIWHTIDGGQNWERQPTGLRASLRSLYFLNPYVGWVAGREELPHGGAAGVLLFTKDGGCTWKRLFEGALPPLNRVRFRDAKHGLLLGEGTDQLPTGILRTNDGGRTWKPVPGPFCPSWLDGDFCDDEMAPLTGVWGRLATLHQDLLKAADVENLGGRSICAVQPLSNQRVLAVGQGGLVLWSQSRGAAWGFADLKLPAQTLASWDFHALAAVGEHVWVVGRPGSVLLRSDDGGRTWKLTKTGQPLPLHGVCFLDEYRGWAVGELGCILHTEDGGLTWKAQHRGGQRAAVLFIHAQPAALPVETVSLLGEESGWLAAGLWVAGPDPKSAAPGQAGAGPRFADALRLAGGAAGELLWQLPLPQHLADADREQVLRTWDQLHGGKAAEQLLRQLVLALRLWRPDVIVTDSPTVGQGKLAAAALVAEAVHAAFQQAADPSAFPEQLEQLDLKPWRPARVFALWDRAENAQLIVDSNQLCPRLRATPREFALPALNLLPKGSKDDDSLKGSLPSRRLYRLLDGEAPIGGHDPFEGLPVPAAGVARRALPPMTEPSADEDKAMRARRTLEELAEALNQPANAGRAPKDQLLAQVKPMLDQLPPDQGAAAAFGLANQYARAGNWPQAQQLFLLMADHYPADPLTADAYRWLIRHNTSSEVRRRYELGQFLSKRQISFTQPGGALSDIVPTETKMPRVGIFAVPREAGSENRDQKAGDKEEGPGNKATAKPKPRTAPVVKGTELVQQASVTFLANPAEARQAWQMSLEMGKRLDGLGRLFGGDPAIQFCLQSARRQLGDFQGAEAWYRRFYASDAAPTWRSLAAQELWLLDRQGLPPRPLLYCRHTDTRPLLDGNFEDACWQGLKPVVLQNAVHDTTKDYHTEVRLAYDQAFLYLALRCTHPPEHHLPPAKSRQRDADLRPYDRVYLLLDLDRDYSTYFRLQVDQRGCVAEDCWGDAGWNPKWYVAVRSTQTSWQIEAAIPLMELTGQPVTPNSAWAVNIIRVLPGRGVQAWLLPADVQPRPEGMGLMMFQQQ